MARVNISYTISVVGGGRLSDSLVPALKKGGHRLHQLISRRPTALSPHLREAFELVSSDISDLEEGYDLLILAIAEKDIEEVLSYIPDRDTIVHTSGTTAMEVLRKGFSSYGVFYPLQTFSKGRVLSLESIPFCIEASDETSLQMLRKLAGSISTEVVEMSSEKRAILHLSAVFACNFSNFMYVIARDLAEEHAIDPELFTELIRETAAKALEMGPDEAQTGPAIRKDDAILARHMEMMTDRPGIKTIYDLLSRLIRGRFYLQNTDSE